MANWTPTGWVGQFFFVMVPFLPAPPEGALPPVLWGDEHHLRALFGDGVSELTATRRIQPVTQFASPQALVDYYKANFGPTIVAYTSIADDPARTAELDLKLLDFAERSRGEDGGWAFEYLEIVARRAS
jgi:hypothetical protein